MAHGCAVGCHSPSGIGPSSLSGDRPTAPAYRVKVGATDVLEQIRELFCTSSIRKDSRSAGWGCCRSG